jgi:transposase
MLQMSHAEIDRLAVVQKITAKQITQVEAAKLLGISYRQVKRIVKKYRQYGVASLVSKRRGKPANNRITSTIKQKALALIRDHYHDFAPTLAHEKLSEHHDIRCSVETLRKWMVEGHLWQIKTRRRACIHQPRARRAQLGELVQIDGSPHDWFEGRGARCNLTVYIDDATGKLMVLHFTPTETTQAYMEALDGYLKQYGRPVALYADKHAIFRVNMKNCEAELTQFARACKTLDIKLIHANTPQAKGRVERANQTLQDRLVKELRLQGIDDIESANAYLPTFIEDYNRRFAKPAKSSLDAHRAVLHDTQQVQQILSLHSKRVLSKNLTCQYKNVQYQIQTETTGYRLRHTSITVIESFSGEITLLNEGKALEYRTYQLDEQPAIIVDEKGINAIVDQTRLQQLAKPKYKPSPDHPWKR